MIRHVYLVVSTPLKNDGVRQWEGLYIPYMKWKIKAMIPKHQPDVGGIHPVLARPCTCIGNRSCNFGPAPQVGAKNQVTTRLMFWNLTKAVQVWKQMANLDNLMIWEVYGSVESFWKWDYWIQRIQRDPKGTCCIPTSVYILLNILRIPRRLVLVPCIRSGASTVTQSSSNDLGINWTDGNRYLLSRSIFARVKTDQHMVYGLWMFMVIHPIIGNPKTMGVHNPIGLMTSPFYRKQPMFWPWHIWKRASLITRPQASRTTSLQMLPTVEPRHESPLSSQHSQVLTLTQNLPGPHRFSFHSTNVSTVQRASIKASPCDICIPSPEQTWQTWQTLQRKIKSSKLM